MKETPEPLEALVAAVKESSKYRALCAEVVRGVGARELSSHPNLKEAIKATKNKLHQVGAAYQPGPMRYARWLEALRLAREQGEEAWRAASLEVMRHHASTRERLSILGEFFTRTLGEITPLGAVLDLACGLNPLAIPWMPLSPTTAYYAVDIYEDLSAFLNGALSLQERPGGAMAADVLQPLHVPPADVALLLKALPCLEQLDRAAALRLLEAIPARYLLVSFPVHSLGGRDKRMAAHYEAHFREVTQERGWFTRRYAFPTELAFLVEKPRPPA
jgi:16S rRNA (guanine(1405)-N(7))-methyltransferase